jgi:hypothetical protein
VLYLGDQEQLAIHLDGHARAQVGAIQGFLAELDRRA